MSSDKAKENLPAERPRLLAGQSALGHGILLARPTGRWTTG